MPIVGRYNISGGCLEILPWLSEDGFTFNLPDGTFLILLSDFSKVKMVSMSSVAFLMLVQMNYGTSYSYGSVDAAGLPVVMFTVNIYPDFVQAPAPVLPPVQTPPVQTPPCHRRERSRERRRRDDNRRERSRSRSRSRERSRERSRSRDYGRHDDNRRSRDRRCYDDNRCGRPFTRPVWDTPIVRKVPDHELPTAYAEFHLRSAIELRRFVVDNGDTNLRYFIKVVDGKDTLYLKNKKGDTCDATYWYLVYDGGKFATLDYLQRISVGTPVHKEMCDRMDARNFINSACTQGLAEYMHNSCTVSACLGWRIGCNLYHPSQNLTTRKIMKFFVVLPYLCRTYIMKNFPREDLLWFKKETGWEYHS